MTVEKKKFPTLAIVVGLILVLSIVSYSFHQANADDDSADQTTEKTEDKDKKDAKTPIPVRVIDVAQGEIASYITATANLVTENEVKVLAEWEGRVARLSVEEGDRVEAGQVLAQLVKTDAEIAVERARIKAANAKLKYDRGQRLVDQELLSPEDFEKLLLENEIAQNELAEAQWRLEKTSIRAPFSGRITERMLQPGQHVRPGDELFTVADFDPLIARIYLPEKDVLDLEEGRKVSLALKADASIVFKGKIRQISPVVDTATGTVKVTIEAVSPPRNVRPGAFVAVDIVRETRQAANLIPREAVVRELQKTYAFVAVDGVAKKRLIELGLEEELEVEVTTGLETGEQVIVAGQGGLKDGAPIKLLAEGSSSDNPQPAP